MPPRPLCCLLALLASAPTVATEAKDQANEFDPFDYAAMVQLKGFLSMGDTDQVLDHIDVELEGYKKLEAKVHFLENTMEEHAERNVVAGQVVEEAGALLQDIDLKVLQVFEEELAGLKLEVERTPLEFTHEVVQRIADAVQEAEIFLQLSKVGFLLIVGIICFVQVRVEQVESEEVEWVVAEAVDVIDRGTEGMDAAQKMVYRKKVQKAWGEELKRKLEGGEEVAAPVGRGKVARVEGERWVGSWRKDKEGERMAKESARVKPIHKTKSTIAEEKEKEREKVVAEIREATKALEEELAMEELEEAALEMEGRWRESMVKVIQEEIDLEMTLAPSVLQAAPLHPAYSPPHLALALTPLAILVLAALLFAIVGKGRFATRRRLFEAGCYWPYFMLSCLHLSSYSRRRVLGRPVRRARPLYK